MSMVNIKQEPVTPVASKVTPRRRKSKRKVSPAMHVPMPINELGVKTEVISSPRKRVVEKREAPHPRLLGGGQEEGDSEAVGMPKPIKPLKQEREREKREKKDRPDPAEEVPKLKAQIKKYEATVTKLVQKFKVEQSTYKKEIQELQATNQTLRDEIMGIRNTIFEITEQRDVETELVQKLKGDNSSLLTKNEQLEQDLSKMIQNISHSDGVLEDMQKRMAERETEMLTLATEKKYLVQQLEDMRRLSRSIDTFSPPPLGEQRKAGTLNSEGPRMVGAGPMWQWLFGPEKSTSRMFVLGILLSIGMAYVLQNLNAAEAINTNDCEYERELFPKEWMA